MNNEENKSKKSIFKRWWFWVIAVVIVLIVSDSLNNSSTTKSVPATADTNSSSTVATVQSSAPQTLLDISGSGSKTTSKFTAANDWDLNWNYDCTNFGMKGNFAVMVYNGDGTLSFENAAVNQLGTSDTGVEHYHKAGTYYLVVNSECKWKVNVQG